MKHKLAFFNQKGGVGKTTTAINLAAYLATSGKAVLLCDIDPQANTTSGLGFDKNTLDKTLYDVLFSRCAASDAIKKTNVSGLDLLPSNGQLAGAEVEMVNQPRREFLLKSALVGLDYDYLIIDCPPSLGLLTVNGLAAAGDVIIPVQAEYYALEGLGQLLGVFGHIKQVLNPDLNFLGILVTLYDSRTSLSEQVHLELEKHFHGKVFATVIPRSIRLAEAPSFGKSIAEHDPISAGAQAYQALAKELQERLL